LSIGTGTAEGETGDDDPITPPAFSFPAPGGACQTGTVSDLRQSMADVLFVFSCALAVSSSSLLSGKQGIVLLFSLGFSEVFGCFRGGEVRLPSSPENASPGLWILALSMENRLQFRTEGIKETRKKYTFKEL